MAEAGVKSRFFPCEGCGADLEFSIGVQSLMCPYCGHTKALSTPDSAVTERDLSAMLSRQARQRRDQRGDQGFREIPCETCGAAVRFVGTLTSSQCAYCGVPLQLDGVHDCADGIPVDGVLSFQISREQAQSALARWVRTRWFAPNAFKRQGAEGRFSGVYLPYWTFDAMTASAYVGERGDHYWETVGFGKNRRRVMRTRWSPASGHFQRFFDDVLVVAGQGLPQERLAALEPWPLAKAGPFNPELLAGFLARSYDVPLEEGSIAARQVMAQAIAQEVRQHIGGDVQRVHSIHTSWDALTYKHLLLPVWMMTYRFAGRPYQVVVNACTGEVQGDRPYSRIKIALAVACAVALAGAILLLARS